MHTAAAEEAAGTVLTLQDFTYQGQSAQILGSYHDFLLTADQLIVYRGSQASPTFLCALDYSTGANMPLCPGNPGGWQVNIASPCEGQGVSALPPGLTRGVDALEWGNAANWGYAGVTSGTASQLRVAIAQISS
eukprot:3077916-Prymnesium_polylepis.1